MIKVNKKIFIENFRKVFLWIFYVYEEYMHKQCSRAAASLSYNTILAFLPIVAIIISLLTAFNDIQTIHQEISSFLANYVLPDTGDKIEGIIGYLLNNMTHLTGVGVISLIILSVFLFISIESVMNTIWDQTNIDRPFIRRIFAFWTTLTLIPVLVSAIIAMHQDLILHFGGDPKKFSSFAISFSDFIPVVLFGLLFALYKAVPTVRISWHDAAIGALITTPLLIALKFIFAFYVNGLNSYKIIYGALAAFPLFVIWSYATWSIILLGAVITSAVSEFRYIEKYKTLSHSEQNGLIIESALNILQHLYIHGPNRKPFIYFLDIALVNSTPKTIRRAAAQLFHHKYIGRLEDGKIVLLKNLETVSLEDLYHALGFGTPYIVPNNLPHIKYLKEKIEDLNKSEKTILKISLSKLFSEK